MATCASLPSQGPSRADTGLTLALRNGSTVVDFPNIRHTTACTLATLARGLCSNFNLKDASSPLAPVAQHLCLPGQ